MEYYNELGYSIFSAKSEKKSKMLNCELLINDILVLIIKKILIILK